ALVGVPDGRTGVRVSVDAVGDGRQGVARLDYVARGGRVARILGGSGANVLGCRGEVEGLSGQDQVGIVRVDEHRLVGRHDVGHVRGDRGVVVRLAGPGEAVVGEVPEGGFGVGG